jgi:L-histidine N-alpha-methyltransferase
VSGATSLVELGSGTSEKTRVLLSALDDAGTLRRYVRVDVDATVLTSARTEIAVAYPRIDVRAVVADSTAQLDVVPREGLRMVAFLGSSFGNFEPDGRADFLARIRAGLVDGETFLLGTDLVTEPARLVAAYDDASGVTAEFNRNVLTVINRELDADFDLAAAGLGLLRWWTNKDVALSLSTTV